MVPQVQPYLPDASHLRVLHRDQRKHPSFAVILSTLVHGGQAPNPVLQGPKSQHGASQVLALSSLPANSGWDSACAELQRDSQVAWGRGDVASATWLQAPRSRDQG